MPYAKQPPLLRLLLPATRSNSAAAAAAAATGDSAVPPPSTFSLAHHAARCLYLVPGLLRRGALSAALRIISRIITDSSIQGSVSAIRYAASLDLPLDHGTLLGALVASGQLVKAKSLFTHTTINTILSNPSVLNTMMLCYSKLGKLGPAKAQLAILIMIDSVPCEQACSALLHALCARDKFVEAHDFIVWMTSARVRPCISAYNLLIPGLCSNGHLEKACHMFDIMLSSGIRPTIHLYRSLVYGFCKGNRVMEAEEILGTMPADGLFPDLRMYTAVMQGYCRAGRMESAVKLFNKIGKHEGCSNPDASAYSRLIYGFMKQDEFDSAGCLFGQMIHRGLLPDRLLCCDLVNWCCRNKKVDSACVLVSKMLESGLVLELGLYVDIISAMCKESRMEEADRWFDKMLESGLIPDNAAFALVIKSYPKGREPDIISKILLAMAKKGCKIDVSVFSKKSSCETLQSEAKLLFEMVVGNSGVLTDAALSVLIHALCINRNGKLALLLMDKMVSYGCTASTFTYNAVIRCLSGERQFRSPGLFISLAQNWGVILNSSSYLILIDACCKHGNINSAIQLFEQMSKRGLKPSVATYDSIIGYLCRDKRLGDAEYMFERMSTEGVTPDEVVYTTLLNGYSKMGRAMDACNVFHEMKRDGLQPSLHAYSALINVVLKKNMFNKACQFLSEMLKQGYVPDTVLYTMLINQFARKGQIDFAFNLYDLMVKEQIEPNLLTFLSLITGACKNIPRWGRVHPLLDRKLREAVYRLCRLLPQKSVMLETHQRISFRSLEEKIKQAYGILELINHDRVVPDLHVYNSMVKFYCTLRGIDDALDVVDSMLEAGFYLNHVTYTILINGSIRSREIDHAVELFNLMNKAGCVPDEITYNTLIKGLCVAGRGIDALSLIYMMQKRGLIPNRMSYDKLVECFYLNYSSDIAFKLFEEMLSHNYTPRCKNYNHLLWILCEERKLLEAYRILDLMLKRGKTPDSEMKKQLVEACYRQNKFELGFLIEGSVMIVKD